MKKSLLIDPGVQKQLRARPRSERAEIILKLLELGEVFGQPHPAYAMLRRGGQHLGLGIRKLRGDLFECRVGLGLRMLFRASSDALIIRFIGSHDEVQNYLRGN